MNFFKKRRMSQKQKNYLDNMKCPICNSTEFIKGKLMPATGGGGALEFYEYENDHYSEVISRTCSECGYIYSFRFIQDNGNK